MLTLADNLDQVLPGIPEVLIPAAHQRLMRSVASYFPAALTRSFDFECRLGSKPAPTDFLFCVTRAERDMLASEEAFALLDATILAVPMWQRIRRFIQAWADPSSPLHNKVIMIWFEFDLPADTRDPVQASLSAPGFFFGSKEFPSGIEPGDIQHSSTADSWLYETALPVLAGGSVPPAVESTLRRVSACLPNGAHVYQLGAFYAREIPQIRVCLTGIRPGNILQYLREIGYLADLTILEQVLSELASLAEVHLDIDVGDVIGPKIGLECSQDRTRFDCLAEKDAHLLSILSQHGLCSPEKHSALLAFPGIDRLSGELAGLHRSNSVDHQANSALLRDLSHIKIVHQPDQPLEAKAYLQIKYGWLNDLGLVANKLAFVAREKAARLIIN